MRFGWSGYMSPAEIAASTPAWSAGASSCGLPLRLPQSTVGAFSWQADGTTDGVGVGCGVGVATATGGLSGVVAWLPPPQPAAARHEAMATIRNLEPKVHSL